MHRAILKATLGHVLWPSFTTQIASRYIRSRRGLILNFHFIGNSPLRGVLHSLFLSQEEFGRILDFVVSELSPLSPMEFAHRLSENTLPPRATLITFDDGIRDTVAIAGHELRKRNLTAFWFVCPGLIDAGRTIPSLDLLECCIEAQPGTYLMTYADRTIEFTISDQHSRVLAYQLVWPTLLRIPSWLQKGFLQFFRSRLGLSTTAFPFPLASWDELRILSECGMYIGNHTLLHSTIVADGIEQFKCDVETAYNRLRSELPQPHRIFSYPYGRAIDASESARKCLMQCNTQYAFVTQGGIASNDDDDNLNLRREDASYSLGATKLAPLLALLRSPWTARQVQT